MSNTGVLEPDCTKKELVAKIIDTIDYNMVEEPEGSSDTGYNAGLNAAVRIVEHQALHARAL